MGKRKATPRKAPAPAGTKLDRNSSPEQFGAVGAQVVALITERIATVDVQLGFTRNLLAHVIANATTPVMDQQYRIGFAHRLAKFVDGEIASFYAELNRQAAESAEKGGDSNGEKRQPQRESRTSARHRARDARGRGAPRRNE